jgi:hypothetical protein
MRKVLRYKRGNQKPYVEEQTIQGPKRKEKNRMTINNLQNTTQATKDHASGMQ